MHVIHGRAEVAELDPSAVVYLDPPYAGTSGYGVTMDVDQIKRNAHRNHLYISEGARLPDALEAWQLKTRKAASLSGKSKAKTGEEWLNYYEAVGRS